MDSCHLYSYTYIVTSIQIVTVAQASFRRRKLANSLQSPLSEIDFSALKQLPLPRLTQSGTWVLGLTGAVTLVLFDGKLMLATGSGALIMLAVYLAQEGKWKVPLADLRKVLRGVDRQIVLAVACGAAATLSTYMAASIWADSGSPWVALEETLQTLGIFSTLGLLGWALLTRRARRDETYFNQLLADLTHTDPLKRLIAVRQITHLVASDRVEPGQDRTIADYFRLLLSREPESVIRDAVLEGLYELDTVYQLGQSQQAPLTPPLKRSPHRVKRRVEAQLSQDCD